MWRSWLELIGVTALSLLTPLLAWAHGDDEIRLDGFVGPVLALMILFTVVPAGKMVIRRIKKGSIREERL